MQRVCDHYISTARREAQASLFVFQFIRSACLAFASTHTIAQLKTLPEPTTQTTLDQHLSILLVDKAPLRMQTEVEAHPDFLFFFGEVIPSEDIRSLAPGSAAKPASRIPRELSQSCLAILRRYEEGIGCFPSKDVQTLCSYMKELCIRGGDGDVWIVLVSFLRDAARPFASTGLRRKLGKSPTSMDQDLVVSQYNALIDDGAMDRLMEAARTRRNPSFSVKPDDSPSLVDETDLDDDSTCGKEREAVSGRKVHELLEQAHSQTSHLEGDGADDWANDDGDDEDLEWKEEPRRATRLSSPVKQNGNLERFVLTGQTGPAGNARPSFAEGQPKRHDKLTRLTPRQIRDITRQADRRDAHFRRDLLAQKEVFYVGGNKKYQIRPQYFWALIQDLEEDEPAIPEDKMNAICPQWKQLVSLRVAQNVASGEPVSPKQTTLQALADKVDALANEITALGRANEYLRREIREMPASPCSCQKNGLSSNSVSSSTRRFKCDVDDADLLSSDSDVPLAKKKLSTRKLKNRQGSRHRGISDMEVDE